MAGEKPAARSAAVVRTPPHLTGQGDEQVEWFVSQVASNGPGSGRRELRVGEHIAADHPLALTWPDFFSPSPEPPDAWPISVPSLETRRRQQAEHTRRVAHHARRVTPCCARCGAQSPTAVIVTDPPTALALISELAGQDDADFAAHRHTEAKFAALARAAAAQARELADVEAEWRAQHRTCPEGSPEVPEPQVPEVGALHFRRVNVRGGR